MTDKKAAARHYARTRKELADSLGYDIDKLTAAQELRLDNAAALKLVSDGMRAALMRGEEVDHRELLAVTDGLAKLLPREREPVVDDDPYEGLDPHKKLEDMLRRVWAAREATKADEAAERRAQGLSEPVPDLATAQARIDELEARLAEFDPKALPAPETEKVLTPTTGNIMTRAEWQGVPPMPGPDDHKARPKIIDGEVVKRAQGPITEAEANAQGLRLARYDEPWRNYV